MKAKNILAIAIMLIGVVACKYDDGDLWNKVNSLDERVSSIENQLKTINSDISALQTIVNALQNNVYVASVETTDDGCLITFSDGTQATITNGKDGADAPVITIGKSSEDNKYYWMQIDPDGTKYWLTDPDTNEKIPVNGTDGITPQLKVDASGYWLISYDNGNTYTQMTDENGNPVKALGEDGTNGIDGDSFFTEVKVEGDVLILVLADGTEIELDINTTGVPSDSKATANPTVNEEDINTNIPNISVPTLEDGTNGKVARLSLTGIQTPDNDWLKLYGTEDSRQNIWMEIDGVPKSISIINSEEVTTRASTISSQAKADVVFLVDNSGSMSEEANAVAEEIISWSNTLSKTMDVQFGCVGIDHYYINGALNITDVNTLSDYLNRSTGTRRTQGFGGDDASTLSSIAGGYARAGGECGGIMLRFADENFNFRTGSNRIYVHLTDEPNQPGGVQAYSVESLNTASEYYDWNTAKGTVHTVFSEPEGIELAWGYDDWINLEQEKPWLMSDYTGGTSILDAPSSFEGVTLDGLPVTGAITNSYIIRFLVTTDLLTGKHTIKITIVSEDGTVKGEKTFEDVEFTLS